MEPKEEAEIRVKMLNEKRAGRVLVLLALCVIFRIFPESKTRTNESRVDKFEADWVVELDRVGTTYSNSIVPGGLLVKSYMTRLTPFTSLTIRFMTFCRTSQGISAASAVIKSEVMTARRATA